MARRARGRARRDRRRSRCSRASSRRCSATPTPTCGEALPAAIGRLTYPIGYWNGLAAAMAGAIVAAGLVRRRRGRRGRRASRRSRRCRGRSPGALGDRLARRHRRGGAGARRARRRRPARAPAWSPSLALGGAGGDVADRLRRDAATTLFDDPGQPRPPAQGDGMLAITLAVVAIAAARCAGCSTAARPARASARRAVRSRAAIAAIAAAVAVAGADRRSTRSSGSTSSRQPPHGTELRVERRGRPAARRRQRPLPVLGDGGRRLRRGAGRAASARAATRPTGSSTARSRSPRPARTRCSSRRWPSSGSSGSR